MPTPDPRLPVRLLAGGGPGAPDPRVLRALTTPLIGQFDPAFTAIMDDVVQLARSTWLTTSPHCFAVSALGSGGLEAVLNSLLEAGQRVAVGGCAACVAATAELVRRLGAVPVALDLNGAPAQLSVVPFIDPHTCALLPVAELAAACHAHGGRLLVDATLGLAACELRVDDWGIDACVAGVDYALGAPAGMSLVTYSPDLHARMEQRASPPPTSYLDLPQLQAYWSPERLNHHTAPTSLVYGLREALRLVQAEGLEPGWQRHAATSRQLRDGLEALGLQPTGALPYASVVLPPSHDADYFRRRLLEDFGVQVTRVTPRRWRVGLLGADAQPDAVQRVLSAFAHVFEKAVAQ